jgi:hypothetical protein
MMSVLVERDVLALYPELVGETPHSSIADVQTKLLGDERYLVHACMHACMLVPWLPRVYRTCNI